MLNRLMSLMGYMFSQTPAGVDEFTSESPSKHFRNFQPFGDKHVHDNHTLLCCNANIQGVVYYGCGLEDLLQVSFGGLRGLHNGFCSML
jgi:hypothetical protein